VESQGTKREQTQAVASGDKEQLERSAEMFEMILQSAPEVAENYLPLKEIYRQLTRIADLKRVTKGLAQVYLDSGQPEMAAKEYLEVFKIDPNDREIASRLDEIGYPGADSTALKLQMELQEIKNSCLLKQRELEGAEEAFLRACVKVRDARRGDDDQTRAILEAIEAKKESETQQLLAERERWLTEGEAQVFNQITESIRKKADKIIQDDELHDIRKSVKQAEKLLASSDSIFQQEWKRISEEREKDFHHSIEEVKERGELELRSAWQELVARLEQEQAAADIALRKVKEEVRELQARLKSCSTGLQRATGVSPAQPSSVQEREERIPSEVVVVAPRGLQTVREHTERTAHEPSTRKTSRDEVGKALGAILVQHGVVSRERLDEAIARQAKDHKPLGQILVECGHVKEEDIINALVAQAGVPYLPLDNYEISDEVATMLPKEIVMKHTLMPVDRIAGTLLVAMGIPLNKEQKEEIQRHLGTMKVSYFISTWSHIKQKHEQHYA